MTRIITREGLAYAAGLFEGEGNSSGRRGHRMASIAMNDLEPLVQFARATTLGRILGPYPVANGNQQWKWVVASFEEVQALAALLWPWLSPRRRQQFFVTLSFRPKNNMRYKVRRYEDA